MIAQDSLPVYFETVPDDFSVEDVLNEHNNSTDVPICVKIAFSKFLDEFQTVVHVMIYVRRIDNSAKDGHTGRSGHTF
ncbi:unnamed protein product [Nippostrongylus brasiliensis]|uniref:Arp2/3 complex 34 kDa subunit n=1 Tax=Nippostrongylus brasiliensis TaxID=27835 RepID=A0A0N4YKK5_NIPBR|nr:unnamed protein product [Nippostrongylus brasiliensis]